MNIKTIDRARAYLAAMPAAISGSAGGTATFNVAVALVRGFSLDPRIALCLLAEWNKTNARPPWSEAELRGKIRSAAKSSSKTTGYLLRDDKPRPAPSERSAPRTGEGEDVAKIKQREAWPDFKPLSHDSMQAVARLRSLPFEAVDLACKGGFLKGAEHDGHKCFILTDGTFAQARRLDGGMLETAGGPKKSKNLFGSQGAFIGTGRKWLGETAPLLLVEGAVGLLEAVAAIWIADQTKWTVLAATSASSRFARDPVLLERLRNRRVRIIPDNDESGLDAAGIWILELETVGAKVDAIALPHGCKDLGDLIQDHEARTETLNELFSL